MGPAIGIPMAGFHGKTRLPDAGREFSANSSRTFLVLSQVRLGANAIFRLFLGGICNSRDH